MDIDPVSQVLVKLFAPAVKQTLDVSRPVDDKILPQISDEVKSRFKNRLLGYGYESRQKSAEKETFLCIREGSFGTSVVVMPTQIHFCIPVAQLNSVDAIFDTYQSASELCDGDDLAAWFTRDKRWLE